MRATFMEFARRKAAAAVDLIRDSDPGRETSHPSETDLPLSSRSQRVSVGTSGSDELGCTLLDEGRNRLLMVCGVMADSLEHCAEFKEIRKLQMLAALH